MDSSEVDFEVVGDSDSAEDQARRDQEAADMRRRNRNRKGRRSTILTTPDYAETDATTNHASGQETLKLNLTTSTSDDTLNVVYISIADGDYFELDPEDGNFGCDAGCGDIHGTSNVSCCSP